MKMRVTLVEGHKTKTQKRKKLTNLMSIWTESCNDSTASIPSCKTALLKMTRLKKLKTNLMKKKQVHNLASMSLFQKPSLLIVHTLMLATGKLMDAKRILTSFLTIMTELVKILEAEKCLDPCGGKSPD